MLLFLTTALIAASAKRSITIVLFAVISQGLVLFPASISPIERYNYCVWMVIISVCVGVFLFGYINTYLAKRDNGDAERARGRITLALLVAILVSASATGISGYQGVLSGVEIVRQASVESGRITLVPVDHSPRSSHTEETTGFGLAPDGMQVNTESGQLTSQAQFAKDEVFRKEREQEWTLLDEVQQMDNSMYNIAQSLVIYYSSAPEEGFDPDSISGLYDGTPAMYHRRLANTDSVTEALALKVQTVRLVATEDKVKSAGSAGVWARAVVRIGDL